MNTPDEYIGCDMHGKKLVGIAGNGGDIIIQVCGDEDDDDGIISVHPLHLRGLAKWLYEIAEAYEAEWNRQHPKASRPASPVDMETYERVRKSTNNFQSGGPR